VLDQDTRSSADHTPAVDFAATGCASSAMSVHPVDGSRPQVGRPGELVPAAQQDARRPSTIQSWIAGLQRDGLGDGYVREIAKTLSACLNAAVADHIIAVNPMLSISLPSAPQRRVTPWTAEMVQGYGTPCPRTTRRRWTRAVGSGYGRASASGSPSQTSTGCAASCTCAGR